MKTNLSLLRSIVGALALLVVIAFPSSTALATGPCAMVQFYYDYHPSGNILVSMYSYPPYNPKIFYTTNGSNPTHDHVNGTQTGTTMEFIAAHAVGEGQCITFKALAHKPPYLDSGISSYYICNLPE